MAFDDWTTDNTCPWCGKRIDDVGEYFMGDSIIQTIWCECPHCDKDLQVTVEFSYTIEKRIEEEEDHEIEKDVE